MISSINTSYRSICDLFDFSKENTADINKKRLVQLAKSGADKPHYKTKLGMFLRTYTSKSSFSYDPVFVKLLKKLRPDWVSSPSDIANKKKQKLIKLAKSGAGKPNYKTKLGASLRNYTCESTETYDPIFTKLIKKLRPDWFFSQSDIIKQKLIKLAKIKTYKLNRKTKLGRAFYNYIKKTSGLYDPVFTKTITKLRPDWFITPSDIANQKKQKLIKLAKSGADKPNCKTKLGMSFLGYINKSNNSYDPIFIKLIKKLRPDWFKK